MRCPFCGDQMRVTKMVTCIPRAHIKCPICKCHRDVVNAKVEDLFEVEEV